MIRQKLHKRGVDIQSKTKMEDRQTETDEMFQNGGKKGERHTDPQDPPRRQGNKQRGHGTYDNDLPPIIGTIGRESGQVKLSVIRRSRLLANCTISEHEPKLLSRKRSIIETINDKLKNIFQIEHSRHRNPVNFCVNVLCVLIAYCHQPKTKKPNLYLDWLLPQSA